MEAKLSNYQTADRGANQRTLNQYQTQLSTLTGTPIIQTRTTSSTRSRLIKEMLPPVKKEKEHGLWFTGWRSAKATGSKGVQWLRDIGLSGVSIDVANVDFNAPKPTHSTPSYAGTYGPDVAQTAASPALSYTHSAATSSPVENRGWQDVEEMQQHQMFERNMTYKSPVNSSLQTPIDYQTLWGEGVGPGVQLPPITFDGAQLNNPITQPPQDRSLQMAGFAPLTGSQASAKLLQGVVSLFLPDMSDVRGAEDPTEHFKRVSHNVLLKYDNLMQIDPHAFSAKAGEFVGEMFALGGLGKVMRVAEGISAFGMACEGGMIGLVVSEAHDTNKVAGVAFGFIGGAAFSRLSSRAQNPLADRAFIRPQGYSKELRFLSSVNQPAYRSGIGNPMNEMVAVQPKLSPQTIERLKKRVSHLTDKELRTLEGRVSNWLGDGTKLIRNKAGDPVFLSQDKMRRVRFDFNNPHGDKMHLHFENKLRGRWKDASSKHRIYPRDV